MSVRTSACWISLNILLEFILFVNGEHFFLPKENNVFSNDLKDDWIPVSGIDKRSTRLNHGLTQVVHITPPIRYSNRPSNQQSAASNNIEVFSQPPPTILGSFSEFGHATIEAREPAHTLNFRPSYNFDRHYDEINERRFQQNDYQEPEDQKPPSIVVFNAQQRHPQNYHKLSPPPPQPFYQNFQFHNINNNNHKLNNNDNYNLHNNDNHNHHSYENNHKNFGFKEPATVQEPPKRLQPYFVPNDHIYPRPQGHNKQVYAEQRPKTYQASPSEPLIQQQQQQQQQHNHHHHHHQQQQPFKSSTEVVSSGYFQKYPGHVENQNLFPQISNYARPFEQTNDNNVFIKPNQYVHNLNVGTEVRFGQDHGSQPSRPSPLDSPAIPAQLELSARPVPLDLPTRPIPLDSVTTGFAHPATRPFSKFQTPSLKNEELYRIFPVKEVNALPQFLPTPVTLRQQSVDGRPKAPYFKEPAGGLSEYDTREEQDENESSEEYDVLRSSTKPMTTTTTSTTTTTTAAPPRVTRKRKPTTTTTTTTTTAPEDYEEYAVPNRQQLQLQEHQQAYRPQHEYQHQQDYETPIATTTEAVTNYVNREERPPVPLSVNKYKKKKPFPVSRPKEQHQVIEDQDLPERMTLAPSPTTTTTTTTAAPTTTTTTVAPQSNPESVATDVRAKTKAKYGNGTRPRFSIKDYKTTTTTTSTERAQSAVGRRTTTANPAPTDPETVEQQTTVAAGRKPYKPRPRPNRYKMHTTTSSTTTEEPQQQQETTERTTSYRTKYKPGKYNNRLRTSTTESATVADEVAEQLVATEPTRPAVYSAKRRTVPFARTTLAAVDENNTLRRSSSVSPPEAMDAASSEDVDYIATTVAVVPSSPRHKYHTSYTAERPLLPIESFFQSSMTGGKQYHNERL